MVIKKTGVLVKVINGAVMWPSIDRLREWKTMVTPDRKLLGVIIPYVMAGMIVQVYTVKTELDSSVYALILLETGEVGWFHHTYIKRHPAMMREDYVVKETEDLQG